MRWWVTLPLLAVATVGCARSISQKKADENLYAKRAYLEQQAEKDAQEEWRRLDEVGSEDLAIRIEEDPKAQWERLPYETIDMWQQRLFEVIRRQNDEIQALQEELSLVEAEEGRVIGEIQQFRHTNEALRDMLAKQSTAPKSSMASTGTRLVNLSMEKPDFFLHFVRPGDTLYSIAMQYYGDKEKVASILNWNQRWIRTEHEMSAGLALILFEPEATNTNPHVVEAYIDQLEVPR